MTLDPAQDPDRFDPARDTAGPLDPAADPDRYDPNREAPTLPGLLGSGAFEEERDGLTWVLGLLGVLGFLALVSVLLTVVPRG